MSVTKLLGILLVGGMLLASGIGGAVAADHSVVGADVPSESNSDVPTVQATYTFQLLADNPDRVEVTFELAHTERASDGTIHLNRYQDVTSTDGFDCGPEECTLTREDGPATLTYRLALDEMDTSYGTSEFAIVSLGWGDVSTTIRSDRGPGVYADVEATYEIPEQGRVVHGDAIVLGDYRITSQKTQSQTFRVIVPGNMSVRYPPSTALGMMANASTDIQGEDETVTAIVTRSIGLLAGGSAIGDQTFLVLPNQPATTWFHEYVHTQQEYTYSDSMRWFTEASAEYYGEQLAVKYGYAEYSSFEFMLSQTHGDKSILSKPQTWEGNADYHKGATVIALLDREIRTATDGERTFRDVFNRLNHNETVTATALRDIVQQVAGKEVAQTATKYTTTEAVPPDRWRPIEYKRAYDYEPTNFWVDRVALKGAGPDWNRSLPVADQHVNLTVGERVSITLEAKNVGGRSGNIGMQPLLSWEENGSDQFEFVGNWNQWIGPSETATRTFTHRFNSTGTYHISRFKGPSMLFFHVEEPTGSVVLDEMEFEDTPTADQSVTLSVLVENTGEKPAVETVPIRVDGDVVAERKVVVDPGRGEFIDVPVTFEEAGDHSLTVLDSESTVTVKQQATPTATATPTETTSEPAVTTESTVAPETGDTASTRSTTDQDRDGTDATTTSGPGFGSSVALLAVLVVALGRWRTQ